MNLFRHRIFPQAPFAFEPRPSLLSIRRDFVVEHDQDIWVERKTAHDDGGEQQSVFCNIADLRATWFEPPSGATVVVYQSDLDRMPQVIRFFAMRKVSREECRKIQRPGALRPQKKKKKHRAQAQQSRDRDAAAL